jgi:hypothetical protein
MSTAEIGNKSRTVIEIIFETLQSINVFPKTQNLAESIEYFCGEKVGSSIRISAKLQENLKKIKPNLNDKSHSATSIDNVTFNVIISTLYSTPLC